MNLQAMLVQKSSNNKATKIAAIFLKATMGAPVLLSRFKSKVVLISWTVHRFKKHMAAKKAFVTQFTQQWNTLINEKISAELSVSRISQTAKVYVAAQSWLIKDLAEHLFDSKVQKKSYGRFSFPSRNNWVTEELEAFRHKQSMTNSPDKMSIKEVGDTTASPPISPLKFKRGTMLFGNRIVLEGVTNEQDISIHKCKKCKKNHEVGAKCPIKKLKIFKPPSKNVKPLSNNVRTLSIRSIKGRDSPEKPKITLRSVAKTSSSLELNQNSPLKSMKKKTFLTLQWLAEDILKMARKKFKLKTVAFAVLAIVRVNLAIENRYFNTKFRIMRKLQPKPYFIQRIVCDLKCEEFTHYLALLGSFVLKQNSKAKQILQRE